MGGLDLLLRDEIKYILYYSRVGVWTTWAEQVRLKIDGSWNHSNECIWISLFKMSQKEMEVSEYMSYIVYTRAVAGLHEPCQLSGSTLEFLIQDHTPLLGTVLSNEYYFDLSPHACAWRYIIN